MFIPKSIVCLKDYSWKQFHADLVAGLVVGLVALPLAMAFAIASGLGPERGLYTAVVAGFLISALSGSRVSIGGPTGAFVVIVAGIVAKYGYDGLAVATGMAGLILIAMGLARLGTYVKYIPYPVTTGFTSGIAVIIFSGEIKDFFGLKMDKVPSDFLEKWSAYFHSFSTFNYYSFGISLFTVLLIVFWPKGWKVPGSIVALVLAAAATTYWNWPVETIGTRFGGIPQSLPHPQFVLNSWIAIKGLFPAALTIAALAAIESLLCAVVADGMIGGRHKSNMELVAQGVANCVSPIFGGMPATGAIARTTVNIRNGGRTPVAGMVHAVVLFIILLVAGPLASHVPLAVLAGILVMVSYHMSEWRSFKFILSGTRSDLAVLLVTFFLTVLMDLTVAVSVGLILAAFLFMHKMAELTQVKALTYEGTGELGEGLQIPEGVEVYSIHGSFFFGAANKLLQVESSFFKKPKALVLEMKGVLHLDTSGLKILEQIRLRCRKQGVRLVLVGIHSQPLMVLQYSNQYQEFGEENFRSDLASAFKDLSKT